MEERPGYTISMKTAVSIPDSVFSDAEKLARRLKKSRSQIYAEALRDFILRHSPDEITDALNASLADADQREDAEFRDRALHLGMKRNEW